VELRRLPQWHRRGARWLVIHPYYNLNEVLGKTLAQMMHDRNARVGPVILATIDRSATHIQGQIQYFDLFRRAIVIPYVATPELAQRAGRCAAELAKCDSGGRVHRQGWMFHGDMDRADQGVRGAMRNLMKRLRQPTSLRARVLSRGTVHDAEPELRAGSNDWEASVSHKEFRKISAATSDTMLNSSLCFSPSGDTTTSRRLFDAVASGCVPVLLRSVGRSPRQWLLGNLPFHHSIDWLSIGIFLAPRLLGQRERNASNVLSRPQAACREEEALWLETIHDDHALLSRMRVAAALAFSNHLDVEFNPDGVVRALLLELSHAIDVDCETRRFIDASNAIGIFKMSRNALIHMPAHEHLRNDGAATSQTFTGLGCSRGEDMRPLNIERPMLRNVSAVQLHHVRRRASQPIR
jgi:hypothetical protein